MVINVKSVSQFAKLFMNEKMGDLGIRVGKNYVSYSKFFDTIEKCVIRPDGHTITGTFKEIGGKWRSVNVLQQNAKGTISTDLLGYGIKSTTVRAAANPRTVATCFSTPYQEPIYKMSLDGGKNFVETNSLLYNGLCCGIKA